MLEDEGAIMSGQDNSLVPKSLVQEEGHKEAHNGTTGTCLGGQGVAWRVTETGCVQFRPGVSCAIPQGANTKWWQVGIMLYHYIFGWFPLKILNSKKKLNLLLSFLNLKLRFLNLLLSFFELEVTVFELGLDFFELEVTVFELEVTIFELGLDFFELEVKMV